MKVLHIASFDGNIGDMANHIGFYALLEEVVGEKLEIEQIEIRKAYRNWNILKFDLRFADYANNFDLVVFGGGAFFKLEWEDSYTGTTIDISNEVLAHIKSKILFNGVGFYTNERTSPVVINKFRRFMDYCINADNVLLTLRNDGSINLLEEIYGKKYSNHIHKIADSGFFTKIGDYNYNEFNEGDKYIALNLDYNDPFIDNHNNVQQIADSIIDILTNWKELKLVFVPHILNDLKPISEVVKIVPDSIKRERISCAPCLNSRNKESQYIFGLYKNSELVIGMRFHSNVCSIGFNKPTIGFGTKDSTRNVYKDIGLNNRYYDFRSGNNFSLVKNEAFKILTDRQSIIQENSQTLKYLYGLRDYYKSIIVSFMKI